jgi:glyoxylase-like metal-dependent hydrolase (beta-lactamase superfamily II)
MVFAVCLGPCGDLRTRSRKVIFMSSDSTAGGWDVSWIHGSRSRRHRTDPPLQVHRYREDTVVMRQSKDATFEAPFLFLLFGQERALLLDTGAVSDGTLRNTVDRLIIDWLTKHPSSDYELVVAHTHGHGDHVAGDASFADRPNTVLVGKSVQEVQAFFGFTAWPDQVGYDLGGRRLEVIGIPGHHPASIALYDEPTGLLFTGDSVYPGRIYVADFPAFVDSMDRLVEFAEARSVTHIVGCHIEMTREPGRDYHFGCRYQPEEPPLQMTMGQLRTLRHAAAFSADRPGAHRFDDFVLYHGMGVRTQLPLLAQALIGRVSAALRPR